MDEHDTTQLLDPATARASPAWELVEQVDGPMRLDSGELVTLDNLPNIGDAQLPAVYKQAKHALAQCESIDECQSWANKAEALRSYARQARDQSLHVMALRIQGRAIRRCGELLRLVPSGAGSVNQHTLLREGDHPRQATREQVATEAGLSEHQRKTALRVEAVPREDFEQQIESPAPPTITALAQQGTASKPKPLVDLGGIPPADYARATEAMGMLRSFAEYAEANDVARIAAAFQPHEFEDVRRNAMTSAAWIAAFLQALPR